MDQAHYETWLAKQSAMGRPTPVTTAPYYANQNRSIENTCYCEVDCPNCVAVNG